MRTNSTLRLIREALTIIIQACKLVKSQYMVSWSSKSNGKNTTMSTNKLDRKDDEGLHDEARRLARLLVSEIKLYNEAQVEEGRRKKDLYERLKDDIDRSRQVYDERVGEQVRLTSSYFYDELVRILADGDASALGL